MAEVIITDIMQALKAVSHSNVVIYTFVLIRKPM